MHDLGAQHHSQLVLAVSRFWELRRDENRSARRKKQWSRDEINEFAPGLLELKLKTIFKVINDTNNGEKEVLKLG
mgnify:CR=1 FL=1